MKHGVRRVWITGASDGLGKAIALQYAARGVSVVLSARDENRLGAVAEQCCHAGAPDTRVESCDYEDTARCCNLACYLADEVDAAVLCVGVSQRSLATDTLPEVVETLFRINTLTPIAIGQTLVNTWITGVAISEANPKSKKTLGRGYGQLALVSSIASHAAVPLRSSYGAAKSALELHAATMRTEISARRRYEHVPGEIDIDIVTVIPGFVKTDISLKALTGMARLWGQHDAGQLNGITSDRAAYQVVRALCKKRSPKKIYVGMTAALRFMAFIAKHTPNFAEFVLARSKTA